jgi:hypothetical protein
LRDQPQVLFFLRSSISGAKQAQTRHLRSTCVPVASLVSKLGLALEFSDDFKEARMAWLYQDPQSRNYKICFRYAARALRFCVREKEL